jgi:diadenosine tetraphosphate (Ap4A) HIT family hydrolase
MPITGLRGTAPATSATPASAPGLLAYWIDRTARLAVGKRDFAQMSPAERLRVVKQEIAKERPAVAANRDPFTPLAARDPAARARETVLWENDKVMVVVAKRDASKTKALVVPRVQRNFITDATPAEIAEMERVIAALSAAYQSVAGTSPADVMLSTPDNMELARMHVHVDPPDISVSRGELPKFYAAMAQSLARRLGPAK